jgi:hypothetical protein
VFDFASGHRKWKLRIGTGPDKMPFNGMLTDLRRWARALGLLRGQRARSIEGALTHLRNYAAHGTYQLLGPVDAARTLSDLREIINQLWGQPTPRGHLYPVQVYRQVLAIAWPREGAGFAVAPAEELREPLDSDDTWEYAIVRAVHEPMSRDWQEELDRFDSLYEVTAYPADLLWGPGRRADAVAWLNSADPQPDTVDFVDRDFVIRHHAARLYMPMRPETAATLNGTDQEGVWHLVRADHPNDAFNHVRNQILGTACQDPDPTAPAARATPTASDPGRLRILWVANQPWPPQQSRTLERTASRSDLRIVAITTSRSTDYGIAGRSRCEGQRSYSRAGAKHRDHDSLRL